MSRPSWTLTAQRHILFLCTEYEGTPHCTSDEMSDARFLTLNELLMIRHRLFEPFADSIAVLDQCETLTLAPPKKRVT